MSAFPRITEKLPFLSSLVVAGIFVLFFYFIPWTGFETNDDALMMHISSGSLSGLGSPFLVYSHYYLCKLLVWLYGSFPGVNFYPLFLFFSHWVALTSLLYFCLQSPGKNTLHFCLFFLLPVETLLLCNLQFTSTAIMVAFGGVMLMINAVRQRSTIHLLLSALLLTLGAMIRWESFLLAAAVGIFPIALEFYRKRWRTLLVVIPFFVVIVVVIRHAHLKAYAERVGETIVNPVTELQMRRIMDFPAKISISELKQAGWSLNDYQICREWFWADPEFFQGTNMKNLEQAIKFDFSLSGKIVSLLHFVKTNIGFVAAFLILFYFLPEVVDKKQFRTTALPILFILISFFMLERLLPRVVIPVLTCSLLLLIANAEQFKIPLQPITFSICTVLLLIQLYFSAERNATNKQNFESTFSCLKKYDDHLIVNKNSCMNLEGCPIQADPRYYSPGNFLWVDVLAGYPVYNEVLQKRGINNLMKAIWERPDVMVLADQVDDIVCYAKEHYQEEIGQTVVERDVNKGVHLFHLWRKNNW